MDGISADIYTVTNSKHQVTFSDKLTHRSTFESRSHAKSYLLGIQKKTSLDRLSMSLRATVKAFSPRAEEF